MSHQGKYCNVGNKELCSFIQTAGNQNLFEGGDDTNPSLCHAGENALLIDGAEVCCPALASHQAPLPL